MSTVNNEPQVDYLRLKEVCELTYNQAGIAYLSACSTTENHLLKLADEVLHFARDFLVASFGQVIATLSPSDDSVSVEIAKRFYTRLASNAYLTAEGAVVTAVQESVKDIREIHGGESLIWAQYIHLGA
jgi:CHAT domain-containing protein